MQANRSRDTKPELELRRLLHGMGLRYRVSSRPLPARRRTADIVFRPVKVAVFVDGCFWHGCPEHKLPPKSNTEFWITKINQNSLRDGETDRELLEAGWLVIRVWEHENPRLAAERIAEAVSRRKTGGSRGS